MNKKLILGLAVLLAPAVALTNEGQDSTNEFLLQYKDEYPGCIMVVEEQLASFDTIEHKLVVPVLLESCIKGREIGEKRTKKMYEIKKGTQPRKLGGFTVKIEPPGDKDENLWDIHY